MANSDMLPRYSTRLFSEIWDSSEAFLEDYKGVGIPALLEDSTATTLFYLLYARFGNSPIANYDETQWKYKVFSVIWQYGPTWEKRLSIQEKLRDLLKDGNEAELLAGTKAIYNSALNPSNAPSTGSLEELDYINSQNTTNYKKSKMEAYSQIWEMLKLDVTEAFLARFQDCFRRFVRPEKTWIYVTEED